MGASAGSTGAPLSGTSVRRPPWVGPSRWFGTATKSKSTCPGAAWSSSWRRKSWRGGGRCGNLLNQRRATACWLCTRDWPPLLRKAQPCSRGRPVLPQSFLLLGRRPDPIGTVREADHRDDQGRRQQRDHGDPSLSAGDHALGRRERKGESLSAPPLGKIVNPTAV